MESIKYLNPKEAMDTGEEPQHRFELIVDGEVIGAAEVNYFSKPIPLYQVTDLYVDIKYKGKGYASKIMDQVEEWLKERHRPGVLVDAIIDGDSAQGMYQKRGWKVVPGGYGLHVFNWPENVDLSILDGYGSR